MAISNDISDLFWLQHREPGKALAEGVSAGSQIAGNFLRGVQLRQQQEQFEAEMPLRWAQLKNEQDRILIQEANTTIKDKMDNEKAAGFGALGAVVAKVGQYQDGWLNPEFGAEFWGTVAKHPQVVRDPGFKSLTDNFDIAERAALRMQEERLRQQGRSSLEQEKQAGRVGLEDQRNQNRIELEGVRQQGRSDLQEDKQQYQSEENEKNRKLRSDIEQAKIDQRVAEEEAKAQAKLNDADYRGLMGKISKISRDRSMDAAEVNKEIDRLVEGYKLNRSKESPAPTPSGPAMPSSQSDFDALPSGSLYINPADGKTYRKK